MLSEICREVSSRNFKAAISVSKRVLSGNFKFFQIKEIFPSFCDLEQKNWRTVFYGTIFFHFRSMSKNLSAFVEFFSAGLLKLRSTCPSDSFERRQFFSDKIFLFSVFYKLSVFFSETFQQACENCIPSVRKNH